jgi:hypothetical protein
MSTTYVTGMQGRSTAEARELAVRIEAANLEARERWGDEFRAEKAAEITELMFEGFQHESLLPLLTTVKNVADGDRILLSEVKGLRVHWISNGGTIDQSVINKETWELVEDRCGWHVSEAEDRILAGWVTAQDSLVDLAIQQMDAEISSYLLRLWQASIPIGHDSYYTGAGVTLALLDSAISAVQEESLDDEPVIIGRASMVNQIHSQILAAGAFLPETNERLYQLGVLGRYKGCRIVRLRAFKDQNNVAFFPRNELYVAGRDAGVVGFWGGLKTREWMDPNGGDDWHLKSWKKVGAALKDTRRVARLVDSALTA